jgi:uncharacterized membrane protein YeiH
VPFTELVRVLDLVGSFVFALSGALLGSKKDMDLLGSFVLALATACGGGALRSMLIGDFPVSFLKDPSYVLICFLAVILVACFKAQIQKLEKPVLILDALGLGIFVSLGISISLSRGLSPWSSLILGIITGSFGGVIRDVLGNEIPLIFQKEIYATACLFGGVLFLGMEHLNFSREISILVASLTVFFIRLFAVKNNWALPKA